MSRRRSGWPWKTIGVVIVLVAATYAGVGAFRTGPEPAIEIEADRPAIGPATRFTVTVAEPSRGLGTVRVSFIQGDRVYPLAEERHDPLGPTEWGDPATESTTLEVVVGRDALDGLKPGSGDLVVEADRAPSWILHPRPTVDRSSWEIDLVPPDLATLSTGTYVRQGGSEAVVYRVGDDAVRDGVEIGGWFFPGYELPGGDAGDRFALFGVPWNHDDGATIRLIAEDAVGNVAETRFVDRFNPRPPGRDTIRVSDGFLERVVPAIVSRTPEVDEQPTLVETYVAINDGLRSENRAELRRISESSVPAFLWRQVFGSLPNAQSMAGFAETRTYVYEGREIDRQTHLGYDLASVRAAPVPAANPGKVVLARYFGIYGNAVIIDHGYGLQSLYGHLTTISVTEGDNVARGDVIGQTGATGLAGGDHLHFAMLIHGLPVDPREWWDAAWIDNRIAAKLDGVLPFER